MQCRLRTTKVDNSAHQIPFMDCPCRSPLSSACTSLVMSCVKRRHGSVQGLGNTQSAIREGCIKHLAENVEPRGFKKANFKAWKDSRMEATLRASTSYPLTSCGTSDEQAKQSAQPVTETATPAFTQSSRWMTWRKDLVPARVRSKTKPDIEMLSYDQLKRADCLGHVAPDPPGPLKKGYHLASGAVSKLGDTIRPTQRFIAVLFCLVSNILIGVKMYLQATGAESSSNFNVGNFAMMLPNMYLGALAAKGYTFGWYRSNAYRFYNLDEMPANEKYQLPFWDRAFMEKMATKLKPLADNEQNSEPCSPSQYSPGEAYIGLQIVKACAELLDWVHGNGLEVPTRETGGSFRQPEHEYFQQFTILLLRLQRCRVMLRVLRAVVLHFENKGRAAHAEATRSHLRCCEALLEQLQCVIKSPVSHDYFWSLTTDHAIAASDALEEVVHTTFVILRQWTMRQATALPQLTKAEFKQLLRDPSTGIVGDDLLESTDIYKQLLNRWPDDRPGTSSLCSPPPNFLPQIRLLPKV